MFGVHELCQSENDWLRFGECSVINCGQAVSFVLRPDKELGDQEKLGLLWVQWTDRVPGELMWPSESDLLTAWHRLVEDPDTAGVFAELVLGPLTQSLQAKLHFRTSDSDAFSDAAAIAVLAFLKNAAHYDPNRLKLAGYLELIATRKLNSILVRDAKHQTGRIPWDAVELVLPAENEVRDEPDFSLDSPVVQDIVAAFTHEERRVYDLMLCGERRTEVFADALDPDNLIPSHPEVAVKRVKDRIKTRLKRAVEGNR